MLIVDVCNLGLVVVLIGQDVDFFLLSMYFGQGMQAEMVCGAPSPTPPSHFGRAPADHRQLCFPGVNHMWLSARLGSSSFIPDFKQDRGSRFLCARVLPSPQITAQKELKGRWDLGRTDPLVK